MERARGAKSCGQGRAGAVMGLPVGPLRGFFSLSVPERGLHPRVSRAGLMCTKALLPLPPPPPPCACSSLSMPCLHRAAPWSRFALLGKERSPFPQKCFAQSHRSILMKNELDPNLQLDLLGEAL